MPMTLEQVEAALDTDEARSVAGLPGFFRLHLRRWRRWQRTIANGALVPPELMLLSESGTRLEGVTTATGTSTVLNPAGNYLKDIGTPTIS